MEKIHDTEVMARLLKNDELEYSLHRCAERIGLAKSGAVDECIKSHKLWEWLPLQEGKKKREKKLYFNKVPPEIIIPYGEQDGLVTFQLGNYQLEKIDEWKKSLPAGLRDPQRIYENESSLTRVCSFIEARGIRIDRQYCERAAAYEHGNIVQATNDFKALTSLDFVDSNKVLAQAFTALNENFPKTDKGNPSFTDDVLSTLKSPVAAVVQRYRTAYKKRNTYYLNFLSLADDAGFLHANIRQAGTGTGRFSMSNPNLQNVTKEEEEAQEFKIRNAFIPRENHFFFEIDFKAMEFRLMLEYAEELSLIEKIKAGLDPHQATADLTGLSRKHAKTLNFGLLYGMGKDKLADSLGITVEEAIRFKRQYFDALPGVKEFIRKATSAAEVRGFVFNWAGRRYQFPDPKFAYKAANAIIQGGCAEIMKFAMVEIHDYLLPKKSKMVLQVHDSLLLEVHKSELYVVPIVMNILRSVYPYKHMPMDVSVAHSRTSWGTMVDGLGVTS
jgi:DNA polymerase I-like protein with 3'-5' exonuclease and polymerase domains